MARRRRLLSVARCIPNPNMPGRYGTALAWTTSSMSPNAAADKDVPLFRAVWHDLSATVGRVFPVMPALRCAL